MKTALSAAILFAFLCGAAVCCAAEDTLVAVRGRRGRASWYGEEYRGRPMADRGRPFDPQALTCASWDYDLGTILEVTSGKHVVHVVVTDRGPSLERVEDGVVIDLSRRAFELLCPGQRLSSVGLMAVTVRRVRSVQR
jgi:rare lipoprotein A (peptidoglycan hydrolase)